MPLPLTTTLLVFAVIFSQRHDIGSKIALYVILWVCVLNELARIGMNAVPPQAAPPASPMQRQRERTPIGHPDELDDPDDGDF